MTISLDRCARCGRPGPGLLIIQLPLCDADRDGRLALCETCDAEARTAASAFRIPAGPPGALRPHRDGGRNRDS
jgi:hypothetical protein